MTRKPFNSQRFKGPLAQVPKPADVVRVMCYGDSLTDGPPKGGWPSWLHRLLVQQPPAPGRRFEVLNAGVAGYSSHQGVLRFLQEVDRYDPDLLLVSFGWNDAAEAIGQPDKSYQIPPWPLVVCQRALIRYRAYLVLMYYTRAWRPEPSPAPAGPSHPRVSIDDYLANLERFRSEALARDIPIVFLTRPHKLSPDELSKNPSWRGSVPRYNAALVDWAKRRDVPVLDVQHYFEQLSPALFSDECHFTREGYQRMGELVRDHLVNRRDGWEPQVWLTPKPSNAAGEAIARAAREASGAPRDAAVKLKFAADRRPEVLVCKVHAGRRERVRGRALPLRAGRCPRHELERLVRGRVVFEVGDPLPDLAGTIGPQDRVDQPWNLAASCTSESGLLSWPGEKRPRAT